MSNPKTAQEPVAARILPDKIAAGRDGPAEAKGQTAMDYAATDLSLAIAHHVLIFLLAGVIALEIGIIRSNMSSRDVLSVARIDIWYGILAGAILVVGFSRAIFAAKGWAYYSTNLFFWAKLGAFAMVGLLSIVPTMAILKWRRALSADAGFLPAFQDVRHVRRVLWLEVMIFAFIPVFAAIMARGYGSLG
jgi:putative membrane protein